MTAGLPKPPVQAWILEVRRFVVGGLVFVLFLAGASLLGIRSATAWALRQNELRLEAEARAVAEASVRPGDPSVAIGADPRVIALLRSHQVVQAAVFDSAGMLLSQAGFLPEATLVPVRLSEAEIPTGRDPVLTRTTTGTGPAIAATLKVDNGTRILRVLYDASSVAAAERMVTVFTVAIPAGALFLALLVAPLLKRLLGPLEALAETARGAEGLVGEESSPEGPRAALATFRRTVDELRRRTGELEEMRRSAEARADALAVTSQTLVRSHPGGLLVVEASGRLAEANSAARELLGLPDFPLGQAAAEALAEWPPVADAVDRALTGEPTLGREAMRGDSTSGRQVAVTAVPVVDAAGTLLGALVFLEDRTGVKKLERELSFRRELASLGEMSAGIAHEFRNATAAILGYARLAGTADDPESRQRHLARIRAEAEHVARVTGDFLLFARPERLQVAPVDLAGLVDEVVAEGHATRPTAQFSVEGDLPVRVADAALLRRALVNLVRNAAEAAGEDGRILVRGESTPDAGFVLTVEDSGPGIAPEAVPKLFVPFSSTKADGTGLGLSLVAKIAALHGASVTAGRSDALGGASFRIAFPPGAPSGR
ncbi:MAG: PAS domain-containing protein [Holophagales bacterium]|nr:PAS domain-containing protein [Holophagales bacterium]